LRNNFSNNQILLIGLATVLFLLAAFALYLLQDLSAPLPFVAPSPTSTVTPIPPSPTITWTPSATSTPTRRPSYTPFASTATAGTGTPEGITITPSATSSPTIPAITTTLTPAFTPSYTLTPTRQPPTPSPSPSATQTLAPGEVGVTGRVVQNGAPLTGVVLAFQDDIAPRLATTGAGGHYWFTTRSPGTFFTLTFYQVNNPQFPSTSQVASLAWIEGNLPTGTDIIDFPDLEISINLNGMIFGPQAPADGVSYSAAAISPSNPIQFSWSLYNQGETYYVELGLVGSDQVLWTSPEVNASSLMWDGTLDNGSHISSGTYWWRVAVRKTLADYSFISNTQERTIIFTP
jgi:hypothetical protein